MKIIVAIPVLDNLLSEHFGHCDNFIFYEIIANKVANTKSMTPPPHQPGVIPSWLAENGVNVVIACGIGQKAVDILYQHNVDVKKGVVKDFPDAIIQKWIFGELESSGEICTHDHSDHNCK